MMETKSETEEGDSVELIVMNAGGSNAESCCGYDVTSWSKRRDDRARHAAELTPCSLAYNNHPSISSNS